VKASDRQSLPGIILVVIGLVLLIAQWFELTGAGVLAAIAAVFLTAYATSRNYGFLIPGMLLGGLAAGVALQESGYDPQGSLVVIGLAGGFFGIFIVDLLAGHPARWWPLIPGGILSAVGSDELVRGTAAGDAIAHFWPVVLIVAGVAVLITGLRSRGRHDGSAMSAMQTTASPARPT
jgi:hypothetical protein